MSDGVDVDGACFRGRLLLLDAEETLATFMAGRMPDAELFMATVGGVIEKRLRTGGTSGLRAYGEMVDVLWKAGNTDGALKLEESQAAAAIGQIALARHWAEALAQHGII